MIKRLPKKAKAGKASEKVSEDSTVTFIRQGALKTFFISSEAETKQPVSYTHLFASHDHIQYDLPSAGNTFK